MSRSAGSRALRVAGVRATLGLSLAVQAPTAALSALILLHVRELGGTFTTAGLAAGAFGLGFAVGGPVLGRWVDRRGQTGVLLATALASTMATLVLAAMPHGTPAPVLVALAALVGLCRPPAEGCVRSLLIRLLADGRERRGAMALEASVQEIAFIVGPALFIAALAATSPAVGLAASGAVGGVATLLFASLPQSRAVEGGTGPRRAGTVLRGCGLAVLAGVTVCLGITFGANQFFMTALAGDRPADVGWLIVAYAVGSLFAGLQAARRPPEHPVAWLQGLCVVAVLSHAALLLATSVLGAALILALAGAAIAPIFAITWTLCGDLAPAHALAEAFTWLGSGVLVGTAAGSALGGAAADLAGRSGASVIAAGSLGAAAALVRGSQRRLVPRLAPSPS